MAGRETVAAELGQDDHPFDPVVVRHRDEKHRLGSVGRADQHPPGIGLHIADHERLVVLRDPTGEALADLAPELVDRHILDAHEHALEGDRLADLRRVVDPVDPDVVVVDEAAGLGHDRRGDALDVLDPVEPGPEVLDRPETGRQVDGRLVQPGVLDGRRHLIGECGRELELLGRPLSAGLVVEDEQTDDPLPEHHRDEADGLDPVGGVGRAHLDRTGGDTGILEDTELPIADHLDAGGARAHRQARHRLADHRAQPALGGQLERMDRRLVDQPERRTLDREERGGEVDDVVEQRGQIGPAGDRRGDPSERLIAGDIATGQSAGVRLRRLASSSGTSIPTPVRDGHVARGTSCGAFSRRRSHARLSVAGRCLNAPYRRVDRLAIARQS